MEQSVVGILGLILGSFVNALVWRLHEAERLKNKQIENLKDYLADLSIFSGHSMCPKCKHRLGVLDLIPVFSWIFLGGECRYCKKPISIQYPLVELTTAGLFLLSYYSWPVSIQGLEILDFSVWLAMLVLLVALAVYDARWYLLPNKLVAVLLILAILAVIITTFTIMTPTITYLFGLVCGVAIIGGSFYILFQVSQGQWIGGGDVKLGFILGLIAGSPLAAALLLFIASISGTLYSFPLIFKGQFHKQTRVPFGPFLIFATIIVKLFGKHILNWYTHQAL